MKFIIKRIFFAAIVFWPVFVSSQGINTIYALRTYFSEQTNYAEITTSIDGSSLKAKLVDSDEFIKQAELLTVIYSDEYKDSVIYVDKRIIQTPKVKDSLALADISLMDMQRIALMNGNYPVYFELRDVNTNNQPIQYNDVIKVDYNTSEINLADIMLIDTYTETKTPNIYTKNGYDLHPYVFDIIAKDNNIINFYTEIYNADKVFGAGNYYAIVTTVEDFSTNKKAGEIKRIKREQSKGITPYIGTVDLSSLAEGSYYLTVEVRNEKNVLYAYKRYPFFKQSDIKQEIENIEIPSDAFVNFIDDSLLNENIMCLRPIASSVQTDFMARNLTKATASQKRYFLFEFYKGINYSNPEKAWRDYMKMVKNVNEKYSTPIKKGYDTDMGRVILAYGLPDNVIDEKFGASSGFEIRTAIDQRLDTEAPHMDPKGVNYYPYQIWVYNHTPFGESNRKFVFYAKQDNLVEYFLLHSNAKGELQDPYWENVLSHGSLEQGVVGKAGKQFQRGHE